MSESNELGKNQQIPGFYKKKESHSKLKTILYKFLVPMLAFVFVALVFFFWKWLFYGVGIQPDQIKSMLASPVLSERRVAVIEWAQGVKAQSQSYPSVSENEIAVLDQLVKSNSQDPHLVNASLWVVSTFQSPLVVEEMHCQWLRISQDLEPQWLAENLVPVQGFIYKMPCLDLFAKFYASGNPEIQWSLATIFGKAKHKQIQAVESLFDASFGSGDVRISLLAGIPVLADPVYQAAVEQKIVSFLENIFPAKALNHQDKIILHEIFTRISQDPGVIKTQEFKTWILRFADDAEDLSIRDRAIRLRKQIAATR